MSTFGDDLNDLIQANSRTGTPASVGSNLILWSAVSVWELLSMLENYNT